MTPIIVVGDVHLDSQAPSSRLDDYPEVILSKMVQVLNHAINHSVKHVFCLGDIFHRTTISQQYLNRVIQVLSQFQSAGVSLYSICGNHDLIYSRMETLPRTPLETLFLSKVLTLLTPEGIKLPVDDSYVSIHGFSYPEEIVESPEEPFSICVAHKFFNNSFTMEDSMSPDLCEELGYDMYLLGHDHVDYRPIKTNGFYVVRPGSLSRGTSEQYNLEKSIQVALLEFSHEGDTFKVFYSSLPIQIQPSKEVFRSKSLVKDGIDHALADLKDKFNKLLQKLDEERTSESDIFSYIDQMGLEPEVLNLLIKYFNERGIYRGREEG